MRLRDISFGKWLKNLEARFFFDTTDLPDEDDRILTRSTCTCESDDAKYVLHGYVAEVTELPESGG